MPIISDIAAACQYYRLPYPMTRTVLGKLMTGILLNNPEARVICLSLSPTCLACINFTDGYCKFSRMRYGWRPEVPPTENAMCKKCTHWQPAETTYLLNVTNKDVNFNIEASYDSNRDRPADTTTQHPRPKA